MGKDLAAMRSEFDIAGPHAGLCIGFMMPLDGNVFGLVLRDKAPARARRLMRAGDSITRRIRSRRLAKYTVARAG